MTREEAEKHWQYTRKIIDAMLEVTHVCYVEAMVHGDKHDKEKKRILNRKEVKSCLKIYRCR